MVNQKIPLELRSEKELLNELKDLNKTIKESNKTNEKFTKILFIVAVVQLLIAIIQTAVVFLGSFDPIIALILEVLFVIMVVYTMNFLEKSLFPQEKEQN